MSGLNSGELRIIGGRFRRRKLVHYPGRGTRPMKERVREAIFNLVGPECRGRHVVDLFAGTGAVGLEALSRGAESATFIERHVPSSRVVAENIDRLSVGEEVELLVTSAFLWAKRDLPQIQAGGHGWVGAGRQWIVFCSPPYDFFVSRRDEMRDLIERVLRAAPSGSTLVVEADKRLDFATLPRTWGEPADTNDEMLPTEWDIRSYPPAFLGLLRDPRHDG